MGTGANGHLAVWGKWAFEKNGHQEKWAHLYGQLVTGANGYLGHLIGQTGTTEADGHRNKQALGANGHLGANGLQET